MNRLEIENRMSQCNQCGFCQAACPVFRVTGHEAGVARGRLTLLRALLAGELSWTEEVEEPLFNCLLCGACTANCFPAVPTADLVLAARQEYLDRAGKNALHRLLFDHLLPYPDRLRIAARAAAVGQKRGLPQMAGALGLLRIFGGDFPEIVKIIERPPLLPLRDRLKPGTVIGASNRPKAGYFVGCGMDMVCPDAAHGTLNLLDRMGFGATVLGNCCCGLPAHSYGDLRAAQKLAVKNLNLFRDDTHDVIVTDCSSCAAFLKKYPSLFPSGDPRREQALGFAAKVRDLTQLVAENPVSPGTREKKLIVTYHDPCHAVRGQGISREPREALNNLPGVEFREMTEADWCCGGAGSYSLTHYRLARRIIDRKASHIAQSQADVVVTSCPACMIHLDYGLRINNIPVKVAHISQMLQGTAAMGGSPV